MEAVARAEHDYISTRSGAASVPPQEPTTSEPHPSRGDDASLSPLDRRDVGKSIVSTAIKQASSKRTRLATSMHYALRADASLIMLSWWADCHGHTYCCTASPCTRHEGSLMDQKPYTQTLILLPLFSPWNARDVCDSLSPIRSEALQVSVRRSWADGRCGASVRIGRIFPFRA